MTIEDLESVKKAVIRRYPISAGIALDGIKLELNKGVSTAAVVAKKNDKGELTVEKIKVNPDFFSSLTFSERVFVLAHEACHISLKHFSRSLKKPEMDAQRKYKEYCEKESDPNKRKLMEAKLYSKYRRIWNVATDACINAFLKRDGLTFPENVIDPKTGQKMQFIYMKDGLIKSAEKIYDHLVKKEEEKEQKKEQQNQEGNQSKDSSSQSSSSENNSSNESQSNSREDSQNSNSDDSTEENDNSQGSNNESPQDEENKEDKSSSKESSQDEEDYGEIDEIDIDEYNGFDSHDEWTEAEDDEEKDETKSEQENHGSEDNANDEKDNEEDINEEDIFNKELDERKRKDRKFKNAKDSFSKLRAGMGLDKYVPVKPVVSWKMLLVGTLEKDDEVWGTRRSSRFNPNARIEERVREKLPNVEVILDTSASISANLLKGFLLQLYPLFESLDADEVSIKVGCFNDSFSGFETIRSKKDILEYKPTSGGNTNFELAATSFSKDPHMTKIVFTDGQLGISQKTRVDNVIWLVFGNKMDFKPVGGRIIKVSDEDCKKMIEENYRFMNENEESIKKL